MICMSVLTFTSAILAAMLVTALLCFALHRVHGEREARRRAAIEQARVVAVAFSAAAEKHPEKIKAVVREMMLRHEGKPL